MYNSVFVQHKAVCVLMWQLWFFGFKLGQSILLDGICSSG
jgi:hypothetical protein